MDEAEEMRADLLMYVSKVEGVNADLTRLDRERRDLMRRKGDYHTQIAMLTAQLGWR